MSKAKYLLIGIIILISSCQQIKNSKDVETKKDNKICLDFVIFPDDFIFSSPAVIANFQFVSSGRMMVNVSDNTKGFQFENSGLGVVLPITVNQVDLNLATFNTEFTVTAFDSSNQELDSITVTKASVKDYYLVGKGINRLEFLGGGNEGLIESICIRL